MTTYYVKNGGNDGLNGLSDANAWATTQKVNSEFAAGTFNRGDSILFKKGDSWSITSTANWIRIRNIGGSSGLLYITSYGSGAKPILDCGDIAGMSAFYVASGASATSSYWVIEALEIRNAGGILIDVHDCTDWWILDCDIHTTSNKLAGSECGIYASNDCTGFWIEGNTIYDTYGEGIYIGSASDASDTSGSGTIYLNTIYDIGDEGIDLKFCTSNINVYNNTLTNCNTNDSGSILNQQAIKLGGQDHVARYNVIRDNGGNVGIGTYYQGAGYAIDTQSMTIEYNQIDTATYGIALVGAAGDVFDDATVRYNEITNCTYDIYLTYTTNVALSYNDVCSGSYGIYASNGNPVTSDYNWFGSELTTNDCYYSADAKTFAEACADVGLECNSQRGKSDRSDVYTSDVHFASLWRMEEATGAARLDSVGSNDLTDNNNVAQTATHVEGSYAADFERSSSQYLSHADNASLSITGDITIVAWVRLESTLDAAYVSKYDGSSGNSYMLWNDSGAQKFTLSGNGSAITTAMGASVLGTATWFHVGGVYNGADIRVYVDGVLDDDGSNPQTYSSGIYDSNTAFEIGHRVGSANYLDGILDEVALFHRELTPWEIASIRENGIQTEAATPSASESASASASPSPSSSESPSPSPSSSPSASESASPSPSEGFSPSASLSPSSSPSPSLSPSSSPSPSLSPSSSPSASQSPSSSPSASLSPSASESSSPSASPSPSPGEHPPAAGFTSVPTPLGLPVYEIWLTTDGGVRIALLDNLLWFNASRVINGIGWLEMAVPANFDTSLIKPDRMVQVWRAPRGGVLSLWRPYFIRRWKYATSDAGAESITISGPDCNDLLRRRIVVGYAAGSYANKTDYADDMMKELVSEAMSDTPEPTPTAGSREWDNLSVAGDLGDGPTLTKSFNFGHLMQPSGGGALVDISKAAKEAGTEVFFDVVPVSVTGASISFQFRTYTGQPGTDISSRVVFDQARGNLKSPELEYDYSEEINYVYSGGQGEEDDRNIQQIYDASRYGLSIWNRCEAFADGRNEEADNGVRETGRSALQEGRPRRRFAATPVDTAATRFGKEWNWGDKVRARYRDQEFDALIAAVTISRDDNGETIQARLEYDDD